MPSFDIYGIPVPAWAWWVPVAAVVLPRLFRWCVIFVAYLLHLLNRKPGDVFEFQAKGLGFHLRHGPLPPEQSTDAAPNEDKTLPSPTAEMPPSKTDEDKGDPAPAGEQPS